MWTLPSAPITPRANDLQSVRPGTSPRKSTLAIAAAVGGNAKTDKVNQAEAIRQTAKALGSMLKE